MSTLLFFLLLLILLSFTLCDVFTPVLADSRILSGYLTHRWVDKGVHTFHRGICPKVNIIARLEFCKNLLNILADLNNAVVWIVPVLPLISSSKSFFSRLFGTVQKAPTMNSIPVTFMFYSLLSSQAMSIYMSFILLSLQSHSVVCWKFFFLLIKTKSRLLTLPAWSISISKSQRILCVSFSSTDSDLCIYHLLVLDHLPHQVVPCIFFLLSLLFSLTMRLFHLYHHIAYICYFPVYCPSLFWYY